MCIRDRVNSGQFGYLLNPSSTDSFNSVFTSGIIIAIFLINSTCSLTPLLFVARRANDKFILACGSCWFKRTACLAAANASSLFFNKSCSQDKQVQAAKWLGICLMIYWKSCEIGTNSWPSWYLDKAALKSDSIGLISSVIYFSRQRMSFRSHMFERHLD